MGCADIWWGSLLQLIEQKTATAAVSTMEAEYQACGAVAREALSFAKATQDLVYMSLDFPLPGPVVVACDNKAELWLCQDQKEGQRSKHIDIVHHFARDRDVSGALKFVYRKSEENISDKGCA
jgi:hypothetical protein